VWLDCGHTEGRRGRAGAIAPPLHHHPTQSPSIKGFILHLSYSVPSTQPPQLVPSASTLRWVASGGKLRASGRRGGGKGEWDRGEGNEKLCRTCTPAHLHDMAHLYYYSGQSFKYPPPPKPQASVRPLPPHLHTCLLSDSSCSRQLQAEGCVSLVCA
jgi:hypothetical protein